MRIETQGPAELYIEQAAQAHQIAQGQKLDRTIAGKAWRPSIFAMNQRIIAGIDQHDMKAVLKPADEHVEGLTIVADRLIVSILLRSPTLHLQAASR